MTAWMIAEGVRREMNTTAIPSVSVVVVTRDRPRDLEVCLTAVLASSYRDFELVVVDQSSAPTSAEIVERFAAQDSRVHLVRDSGRGAARARNLGAATAHGDIVVFTDDDTEPDPTWLAVMVRSLESDPQAGTALGSVIPAPHDQRSGFVVGFVPTRRRRLRGRLAKLADAGISANVGFRRSALEATGGFDELLGAGSYFPSMEDQDLTYRVLARGYAALHVPDARVVHHGFRDWQSGSGLIRRTYIAMGATYMKYLRMRDLMGSLLLMQAVAEAVLNILTNVARRRKPVGFGRLGGLFIGAWRSFELEVDSRRALYCRPR